MEKRIMKKDLERSLSKLARQAKDASHLLGNISCEKKKDAILKMSEALLSHKDEILAANKLDLKNAFKKKLSSSFVERLTLSEKRIQEMAQSLREIAGLDDPVGKCISSWKRPNGLVISKVRVPIGTILILYEARPNVTSDCIGLCLKSGNSVILRGGSDALHSNTAIFKVCEGVLKEAGLPKGIISFVKIADRRSIDILLRLDSCIDLVMPRGGESLINEVRSKSKIPIIKHYKGVCHVYVEKSADFAMAQGIILNAKVQRPSVCNAAETLLVDQSIAKEFLPTMIECLEDAKVEVRGCPLTRRIVSSAKKATEADWFAEYLDLILAVKVVKNIDEAIAHINRYGSNHSDAIVTRDERQAEKFLQEVDSACVYANASTRFTDGFQFGFGAEIGISTDKLHARGPMGLEELTTYKYVIRGSGQIRE
jgi:glutamate-5-semialdehyde dehydrogenase